jgi:hypothetical protein
MKEIDTELYEKMFNELLPGLTMFVRDVNLSQVCAEQYKPNMIIMERGFTDASCRVGGMVTTHRFAILSNHMSDIRQFEHDTNWGLFISKRNAHFKVLDVYDYKGRTQIVLLHLPDDNRWKLFENLEINIIEQIVKDCRNRFEAKSVAEPIPELAKEDWLERCALPLGMSEDGTLFDINPSLRDELRPISGSSFRDFYHKYIYLEDFNVYKDLVKQFDGNGDLGVIAYGYIDEEAGLSFQIVDFAAIKDDGISLYGKNNDSLMIVRFGSLKDSRYMTLDSDDIDLEQYRDFEKMINEGYATDNQDKEQIRSFAFLDSCRHPEFPDDIAVILLKGDNKPERVWVRGNQLTDQAIMGELLNEPNNDFGVHLGDSIRIVPYKQEDGNIVCVSPQDN